MPGQLNGDVPVHDRIARPRAVREGRAVDERLERRTRLTPGLLHVIERFVTEVIANSILIENVAAIFEYPRDPDDAHYVASPSTGLVTETDHAACVIGESPVQPQEGQNSFKSRALSPAVFLCTSMKAEM